MSGLTGIEAVPEMTSKECRNFDRSIWNACRSPHIPIPVSAPCRSLAEPLREPVGAHVTLVTCEFCLPDLASTPQACMAS